MTKAKPPEEHVPLASQPAIPPGMNEIGKPKMTNAERRARSLERRIRHAHDYRVQIWATMSLKVNALQQERVELGFDEVDLYEPDFKNRELLEQYAKAGNWTG